jgi:hypothetical protein
MQNGSISAFSKHLESMGLLRIPMQMKDIMAMGALCVNIGRKSGTQCNSGSGWERTVIV